MTYVKCLNTQKHIVIVVVVSFQAHSCENALLLKALNQSQQVAGLGKLLAKKYLEHCQAISGLDVLE